MPGNELNGLLRSLAGIPGARIQNEESVRFDVKSVEAAMEQIRKLQGTGQLTINFAQGRASGQAQWKPSAKE